MGVVTPYRYQQRQIQEALREVPSLESGEEGERRERVREGRRTGGREGRVEREGEREGGREGGKKVGIGGTGRGGIYSLFSFSW